MTTGIVYDDIYLEHNIGTQLQHQESHERLIAIMNFLKQQQLFEDPNFKLIKPRKATLDQIKYVHRERLIKELQEICDLSAKTHRLQAIDMDTVVCPQTYEASLFSVGGNLQAIDEILNNSVKNAFALVRPPGHHSNSHRFAGFCLFNNIAIAAEYLFREKGVKKIVIVDWDCHHGNGTQDIFYQGPKSDSGELVMFNSHQDGRTLYPGSGFIDEIGSGKGEGRIINYPMPPGSADDVIPIYFNEIIAPICDEFKPEFILISAGFDTHWTDYTNMNWTYQAPANYLKKIRAIAQKYSNDRILITLEGGYELDKQARGVYNCLKVLNNEDESLILEEPRSSRAELLEYFNNKLIPALKDKLKPYWECF